ncbi:MAG TPA: YidB family protein [Methylophilaceae bacterium]|nr:YidB family protein [Methylophilaceae bacterium]
MGLFDTMASAMITSVAGAERGPMVKVALDLFNRHGGVNGILDKFRRQGLGDQVDSWISTGANLSLTAKQVQTVLGECVLDEMSARFDVSSADLSKKLAEHLPKIVDQLSPEGVLPTSNSELLMKAVSIFKNY